MPRAKSLSLAGLTLLGAACITAPDGEDATEEVLGEWETAIALLDSVQTGHSDAVAAATTVEEVATLEDAYVADWETAMVDVDHVMESLMACDMDDSAMTQMSDADTMIAEMEAAVADHMADHAAHVDVSECQDDEAEHGVTMADHLGTLAGYHDAWHASMTCEDHAE